MDSDEDINMDVEPVELSSFAKGKGKAIDHGQNYGQNYDDDNLPWLFLLLFSVSTVH
jgi:hypothetical protein